MSRRLSFKLQQKILEDAYCEKHLEPHLLFCDDDQITLCDKCLQSQEHKNHMVYGVQEAAENYRKLFQELLNTLTEKLEVAKNLLADEKERMVMVQGEEQNFKEMIESEYKMMFWLMTEENEMNFQSLQPELFNQNLRKASQRQMMEFSAELEEKSKEMIQNARYCLDRSGGSVLLQCLEPAQITDLSLCQIPGMNKMLKVLQRTITLDPKTAHPYLVLSEDLRSIRLRNVQQDVPGNPGRFDFSATVLGVESFTSGRHYWEVDVQKATEWQLGVYEDSAGRKGDTLKASRNKVLLTGSMMGTDYTFWVFPPLKRVSLGEQMHKVGVFLDCKYQRISFYDVTKSLLIYNFSHLAFQGALRPIFSLCIPSGGTDSNSLSICLPDICSCNVIVSPQSPLV
uniref:Tripartite motif family like 2 n=1 Tax=Rousettus aegyptiacus TaxID=9407 RepID=A0A7J8DZQ1_ROUAE|nr:tripartite motif family like 2 [Rousettus aegyptiacus]